MSKWFKQTYFTTLLTLTELIEKGWSISIHFGGPTTPPGSGTGFDPVIGGLILTGVLAFGLAFWLWLRGRKGGGNDTF